jgi:hypothetical protein
MSGHKYEPFDADLMEDLKEELEVMAEQGTPADYEIRVNERRVIPRTSDISLFDNYHRFMNERTRIVRLTIFKSANPRFRHAHYYNFYTPLFFALPAQEGLSGLPGQMENASPAQLKQQTEAVVQQALAEERQKSQITTLERELEQARKELTEAKEYIELLETRNTELSQDKFKIKNLDLGELGGVIIEKVLQGGNLFKGLGAGTLAGNIENGQQQQKDNLPVPDVNQVSCSLKETSSPPQTAGTSDETARLVSAMESGLSQTEKDKLNLLIHTCISDPEFLNRYVPDEALETYPHKPTKT